MTDGVASRISIRNATCIIHYEFPTKKTEFGQRMNCLLGAMKTQVKKFDLVKGAWSSNRKQTCYLYNLYCYPHLAIVFCKDFGGWRESTITLLKKSTNICAIVHHMRASFVALRNSRVHIRNNSFTLGKSSGKSLRYNLSKILQIVVSKELCLYFVTQAV